MREARPAAARRRGGNDEAELEVFAVVERMVDCGIAVDAAQLAGIGMDRDRGLVEDGPETAALGEDVGQVGGEAVGDVDHGVQRRGLVQRQGLGDSAARAAGAGRRAGCRPSGPVTRIASPGLRPAAADRAAGGRLAEQRSR